MQHIERVYNMYACSVFGGFYFLVVCYVLPEAYDLYSNMRCTFFILKKPKKQMVLEFYIHVYILYYCRWLTTDTGL